MRFIFVSAVALAVLLGGFGRAQADGGYRWQDSSGDDPPQMILWQHDKQIGNYRLDTGEFVRHKASGGFEDAPSEAPFPIPTTARKKKCGCCKGCACIKDKCGCKTGKHCSPECKCGEAVIDNPAQSGDNHPVTNYGIQLDMMGDREKTSINGREVTKAQAVAELEANAVGKETDLPDDSEKVTLAIISDNPDVLTRAKLDWMNPALAAFRKNAVEQFYDLNGPERPMLNCGFVDRGTQVIVQKGNRVLWDNYTEGYQGLPTMLAAAYAPDVVREVRKIDPAYDRAKDPGPHNSGGIIDAGFDAGAWIIGAILGLACPFIMLVLLVLGGCALYRLWRDRQPA